MCPESTSVPGTAASLFFKKSIDVELLDTRINKLVLVGFAAVKLTAPTENPLPLL